MQQAAFDERGIDATYELWDRAADRSWPTRSARSAATTSSAPTSRSRTRSGSSRCVDRLTEEAHATGAVNTITREGKRLVGHNTDVPGFKVALDQLVGRQKMPRAGGRARRRRRRAGGRLRAHHARASSGSSCSTATSIGPRRWSSTSAGARPTWSCGRCPGTSRSSRPSWQDEGPHQRDVDRAARRRVAAPGRDPPGRAARARPDLQPQTRFLRDAEAAGATRRPTAS